MKEAIHNRKGYVLNVLPNSQFYMPHHCQKSKFLLYSRTVKYLILITIMSLKSAKPFTYENLADCDRVSIIPLFEFPFQNYLYNSQIVSTLGIIVITIIIIAHRKSFISMQNRMSGPHARKG